MGKYRKSISRGEFERIERYLLGSMGVAEREAFEQAMSADETLRHEVELQRMLVGTVELGTWNVARMVDGHTQQPLPIQPPRPLRFGWYAAVALLLIGLGWGAWWFFGRQDTTQMNLYAIYFRPDPGLPVTMGHDSVKYLFNEGMVSYQEGQYDEAIDVWDGLTVKIGTSDTLQYYIGVAYMNLDRDADALTRLAAVAADSQSVFREKATWYLALIALKNGDYARTEHLLMALPEWDEAVELLKRITDRTST